MLSMYKKAETFVSAFFIQLKIEFNEIVHMKSDIE